MPNCMVVSYPETWKAAIGRLFGGEISDVCWTGLSLC